MEIAEILDRSSVTVSRSKSSYANDEKKNEPAALPLTEQNFLPLFEIFGSPGILRYVRIFVIRFANNKTCFIYINRNF